MRINRIRLEFKEKLDSTNFKLITVLIESDWNLKVALYVFKTLPACVLIESDWNLKKELKNLYNASPVGINRIRLEFKVFSRKLKQRRIEVLIESDWNLKSSNPVMIKIGGHSINRIRLEFKVQH